MLEEHKKLRIKNKTELTGFSEIKTNKLDIINKKFKKTNIK